MAFTIWAVVLCLNRLSAFAAAARLRYDGFVAEQIAAGNAEWPLQFRFAVHIVWPVVHLLGSLSYFARVMETTPRYRKALDYAQESLSRFCHAHLSSAHLILGLLTLQGGVAGNVLRKSGLSIQSVEAYLSSRRTS